MPLHDTSHIPDDPEYWSSLTERVAQSALASRRNVVFWLSRSPGAWIVAASLIAIVGLGWVTQRAPGASPTLLEPPDAPPSVSALLFSTGR